MCILLVNAIRINSKGISKILPPHFIQFSPEFTRRLSKLISSQHSSFVLYNAAITTYIWMNIKHLEICIGYAAFWDASNVNILINSATTPGPTVHGNKHIFKGDLKGNSLI